MKKGSVYMVGDTKVSYYQKFTITTGILVLAFFSVIAILFDNQYYAFFPVLTIVLFAVLVLMYTKLYSVKYNTKYFYLSNLFFKKQISTMDFIEVKSVKHAGFLLKIVFKEKHFYLLAESNVFFGDFFKTGITHAEEITLKIKEILAK